MQQPSSSVASPVDLETPPLVSVVALDDEDLNLVVGGIGPGGGWCASLAGPGGGWY